MVKEVVESHNIKIERDTGRVTFTQEAVCVTVPPGNVATVSLGDWTYEIGYETVVRRSPLGELETFER